MLKLNLTMIVALLAVALAAPLLSLPASAQGKRPCMDDIRRLCPDVQFGDRAGAMQCLQSNAGQLSSACQKNINKMRRQGAALAEACREDAERLCGGVKPGDSRMRGCFRENWGEVSPGCQEAIEAMRSQRK